MLTRISPPSTEGLRQVVLENRSDRQGQLLGCRVTDGRDPQHVPAQQEPGHLGAGQRGAQGPLVVGDHARQGGQDGTAQQVAQEARGVLVREPDPDKPQQAPPDLRVGLP